MSPRSARNRFRSASFPYVRQSGPNGQHRLDAFAATKNTTDAAEPDGVTIEGAEDALGLLDVRHGSAIGIEPAARHTGDLPGIVGDASQQGRQFPQFVRLVVPKIGGGMEGKSGAEPFDVAIAKIALRDGAGDRLGGVEQSGRLLLVRHVSLALAHRRRRRRHADQVGLAKEASRMTSAKERAPVTCGMRSRRSPRWPVA
ncbi:hypothetical protein GCM10011390_20740 [Aureimonas endophytica]|uniref:Uncharacterized protein n=1 Tax=Aureimonas endophytica TaxID=2027858 RepID=A0A916ZK16_9HYPH|nr:hypothetical protein GCM10011390_20740 [Aureimonas endophytica]